MINTATNDKWRRLPLSDILQLKYGDALPENKRILGSVSVYGSNGIIGKHNQSIVQAPAIIVGRKGSVGKVNLSPSPCWVIDTAFYSEIIDKNVYYNYLFHFLNQLSTKLIFPKGVKPGINRNEYLSNLIPIPFDGDSIDYDEQKRIADKIEKLFGEIDKTIEKTKTGIAGSDNLFLSVLNNKINDGLSQGWVETPLIELASFFNDGDWVEKRHQSSSGIRLIQTGNIGVVDFKDKEDKKYITEETFNLLRCKDVLPGDILISRLPEPVGRASIIPELEDKRLITAVDCTIVRLKSGYVPGFVNYLLNSRYALDQVHYYLTGSSRKRISRTNLEKIKLPVPVVDGSPDKEKQTKIVNELNKVRELSFVVKEKYQKQLAVLETLKQSLLNQAFQGKL